MPPLPALPLPAARGGSAALQRHSPFLAPGAPAVAAFEQAARLVGTSVAPPAELPGALTPQQLEHAEVAVMHSHPQLAHLAGGQPAALAAVLPASGSAPAVAVGPGMLPQLPLPILPPIDPGLGSIGMATSALPPQGAQAAPARAGRAQRGAKAVTGKRRAHGGDELDSPDDPAGMEVGSLPSLFSCPSLHCRASQHQRCPAAAQLPVAPGLPPSPLAGLSADPPLLPCARALHRVMPRVAAPKVAALKTSWLRRGARTGRRSSASARGSARRRARRRSSTARCVAVQRLQGGTCGGVCAGNERQGGAVALSTAPISGWLDQPDLTTSSCSASSFFQMVEEVSRLRLENEQLEQR